jgi:hypothetical protein
MLKPFINLAFPAWARFPKEVAFWAKEGKSRSAPDQANLKPCLGELKS